MMRREYFNEAESISEKHKPEKATQPKAVRDADENDDTVYVQDLREISDPEDDVSWKKSESYDFGDPRGIIVTILLMPLMVYTVNAACNKTSCSVLVWPEYPEFQKLFDADSLKLYAGWLLYVVVTYYIIPGRTVIGQSLAQGRRLVYTCNGFRVFVLTLILFFFLTSCGVHVVALYDRFYSLMTSAILTASVLSVFLYYRASHVRQEERSETGNTGYVFYDFYLGKELNPRLGYLDLKFVCELRPGLIAWILLDLTFVLKAIKEQDQCPTNLILLTMCHVLYVADALYFEEAVLTTLDITKEGFGFMLVFGDLVWVPSLFSLQARYLLLHPNNSSATLLATILLVNGIGYWIFRAANNEKDSFKKSPHLRKDKDVIILSDEDGRTLLASGWWGRCRHPNYFGDITMSICWASLCGVTHFLPWFYPFYLCGTLVHRCKRDDAFCRRKYGKLWTKYCKVVPYKIIPAIY